MPTAAGYAERQINLLFNIMRCAQLQKENLPRLHDQIGSPELVGKILVELMEKEELPQRLLLGSDGVATGKKVYTSRLAEIERWEEISVRTDYY